MESGLNLYRTTRVDAITEGRDVQIEVLTAEDASLSIGVISQVPRICAVNVCRLVRRETPSQTVCGS